MIIRKFLKPVWLDIWY